MKTILKSISVIILLAIVGCKHEETLSTVNLQDTYGAFEILEPLKVTKDTVGFLTPNTTVAFTAKFSIRTRWQLTIVGKKSKVVKTMTGSSKF